MKKLILLWTVVILGMVSLAHADLTWNTPIGTIGLPFQSTELFLGGDLLNQQGIGGVSLPVYQTPNKLFSIQLGAGGQWPTQGANTIPYVASGLDLLRFFPMMDQFKTLHLNAFSDWASNQKHPIGAGLTASWSFAAN